MARAIGPSADAVAIARRIRSGSPQFQGESFLSFLTVAQAAVRSARAGREVRDQPNAAVPGRDLPTDTTIAADDPRYRYRVVVRGTNTQTGEVLETLAIVNSDQPMTANMLAEAAVRAFQQNDLQRSYRATIDRIEQSPAYETVVVSAGRRA